MRERIEGSGSYRRGIVLVLLAALAVLLLASCESIGRDPGNQDDLGEPTPEQQAQGTTGPPGSITLEELTRRPERFYGERVNVNGTVGRTLSPNTFTLTSAEAQDSDEATEVAVALVAGEEGSVPNLSEGQRVRVTGEAQEFIVAEVEEELGVGLDDSLYSEFGERPVILLGTVEVIGS